MSMDNVEFFEGYVIHFTRCPDENGRTVVEWTIDDAEGVLVGAGYCATQADASNDAREFIGGLIANEGPTAGDEIAERERLA